MKAAPPISRYLKLFLHIRTVEGLFKSLELDTLWTMAVNLLFKLAPSLAEDDGFVDLE